MTAPLDLSDITLPRQGTTTVRAVLNAYLREAVRTWATLPPGFLTPATRTSYAQSVQWANELLRRDPRPLVAALRSPTVGALLWPLSREAHEEGDRGAFDRWTWEATLLVAFELALSGALPPAGLRFVAAGRPWPALRHVGANLVVRPAPSVRELVVRAGRVTFVTAEGTTDLDPRAPGDGPWTITRPYHRIVDGVVLALEDNNPLSHFEAHPDKQGNALDLGGKSIDDWLAALRGSFALVDEYLPVLGEEMRLVLRLIVPVGWHEQKHLSASYKEAIGTVYMTLHPNPMTMVEALIHEFQHNKLNTALHLDPLLHNAFSPLYSSPVRPDPRPLHGVVLAVHAFQPVAKLYEVMAAQRHPWSEHAAWSKRFRDIIRMDRAGAGTVLENAQATPVGEGLFREMRALDEHLGAYEAAHWSEAAQGPAQALPE